MLHLQAGIHFQKIEISLRVEKELHCSGIPVARQLADAHRGFAHAPAQFVTDGGRRAFLHHFLVPPLQRAFALAQVNQVAVPVAENLDFHVAGVLDVLFQVNRRIVESVLRLGARRAVGGFQFGFLADHPQSLAPPAGRGLQHHGVADLTRDALNLFEAFEIPVGAGDHRQARLDQRMAGGGLRAHQLHGAHRRTDENDSRIFAGAREFGVFRQKSVTGVNRFRAAAARGVEDAVDAQVAFRGRRRADRICLVSIAHVQRFAVNIGVHRHGADVHLAARAHDAHGNLSTIGDEDFTEHGFSLPMNALTYRRNHQLYPLPLARWPSLCLLQEHSCLAPGVT